MLYSIIMINGAVPESWRPLLMSPLAENNGDAWALRRFMKKHSERLF